MEEMKKQIGRRFRVAVENFKDPTQLFFHSGILKDADNHGIWLILDNGKEIYLSFDIIRQATYDDRRE